jgi:hypothetical protein
LAERFKNLEFKSVSKFSNFSKLSKLSKLSSLSQEQEYSAKNAKNEQTKSNEYEKMYPHVVMDRGVVSCLSAKNAKNAKNAKFDSSPENEEYMKSSFLDPVQNPIQNFKSRIVTMEEAVRILDEEGI